MSFFHYPTELSQREAVDLDQVHKKYPQIVKYTLIEKLTFLLGIIKEQEESIFELEIEIDDDAEYSFAEGYDTGKEEVNKEWETKVQDFETKVIALVRMVFHDH